MTYNQESRYRFNSHMTMFRYLKEKMGVTEEHMGNLNREIATAPK